MKRTFLSIISIYIIFNLSGQEETEYKGRFFISPDLGLMVGTTTRIELAPMFGYYLTNRISVAAGARYEYYNYSRRYYGIFGYETSIYGPRLQTRLILIRNIDNVIPLRLNMAFIFQAEQELLSLQKKYFKFPPTDEDGRFWQPVTLAGFGISQLSGGKVSLNITMLWDIENKISSPYINPVFRVGFQYIFGDGETF